MLIQSLYLTLIPEFIKSKLQIQTKHTKLSPNFKQQSHSSINNSQMWTIYSQNIQKHYFTPILSRGFMIAAMCYLIAFIVPVLILVSIGYSWIQDSKVLLKPVIKYENYQLSCLMADQSSVYDSSFSGESQVSQRASVAVGSDSNMYTIGVVVQGNVLDCTVVTYNRVLLNDNYQVLVTIPFSFSHTASNSSTNLLNKITQKGKIQVFASDFLLDTTVPFQQVSYQSTQDFSILDNVMLMSSRNLSAFVKGGSEKKEYGNGSGFEFLGYYEIQAEMFVKSQSLLNKIRSFVPFYMFLWFPIFFFVVLPLVRWMFSTKLYYAKCDKAKIKLE